MKRVLILAWCWASLAIWVSVGGLMLRQRPEFSSLTRLGVLVVALVFSILFGAFIIRRSIQWWVRRINAIWYSLLFGSCMALLLTAIAFACWGYQFKFFVPVIVIVGSVSVLVAIWPSFRYPLRILVWSGFIVAVCILIMLVLVLRQDYLLRTYARQWKGRQWPMSWSDALLVESTRDCCKPMFDVMADHTGKEWASFSNLVAKPLETDVIGTALSMGIPLKKYLLLDVRSIDDRWSEWWELSSSDLALAVPCSYVQWYALDSNPLDKKANKLPDLLAYIRWSRMFAVHELIEVAKGNSDNILPTILDAQRISKKLRFSAQPIMVGLIGIAAEKMHILLQASNMTLSASPMTQDHKDIILEEAFPDLQWLHGSLHCERLYSYLEFKSIDLPGAIFPFHRSFTKAVAHKETYACLENWSRLLEAYDEWSKKDWLWKARPSIEFLPSTTFPDLDHVIGRAIVLAAQARLILMMDEVLKYRQEHKALPESLDFVTAPWRIDPFDERPLRYEKEGESTFVVWSVGPDGRDDGGQSLYVAGAMEFKDDLKEDIGFRVALPPSTR